MGFLDPFFVTTFKFKKISLILSVTKSQTPNSPLNHGRHKSMTPYFAVYTRRVDRRGFEDKTLPTLKDLQFSRDVLKKIKKKLKFPYLKNFC